LVIALACTAFGLSATELHDAVKKAPIEQVQVLVDGTADLHEPDEHGSRPLQLARAGGRRDVVRMLLGNEAEPNRPPAGAPVAAEDDCGDLAQVDGATLVDQLISQVRERMRAEDERRATRADRGTSR
jgi:ankyrin repeat protein